MKKEELKPIHLGHLEEKCLAVVDAFRKANEQERSKEYRAFHLKSAEQISQTLLRDFGYYHDKYLIGGTASHGLSIEQTD